MGGFSGGGGGGGGSVSIGDAIGSGTADSVLFIDGSGNLAQDNADLNFDGDHFVSSSKMMRRHPRSGLVTVTVGFMNRLTTRSKLQPLE